MVIDGTMKVKVNVEPSDAMEVVKEALGLVSKESHSELKVLEANDSNNNCGTKAIYEITDMSWYGSYNDEYKVITTDTDKIAIFESFQLLENAIKNNKKVRL